LKVWKKGTDGRYVPVEEVKIPSTIKDTSSKKARDRERKREGWRRQEENSWPDDALKHKIGAEDFEVDCSSFVEP